MRIHHLFFVCLVTVFLSSCSNVIVRKSYPQKFQGLTQLVLASETTNMDFVEVKKTKFLFLTLSSAKIRVIANATFDFYCDFQKDGYQIQVNETQDEMTFLAPPIHAKKPQFNSTQVSYPDRGLLVDEEKAARKILQGLSKRVMSEGEALLQEQYVIDECRKQLTTFVTDLCQKLGYNYNTIKVAFYGEPATT